MLVITVGDPVPGSGRAPRVVVGIRQVGGSAVWL